MLVDLNKFFGSLLIVSFMEWDGMPFRLNMERIIVTHERFLKCLSEKLVQVYASSVKV